jgi:hypothetical protein
MVNQSDKKLIYERKPTKYGRKGYATIYFTYTSSIIVKEVKIQEEHIICKIHDHSKDVQINEYNKKKWTTLNIILSPNHGNERNKHHPSL